MPPPGWKESCQCKNTALPQKEKERGMTEVKFKWQDNTDLGYPDSTLQYSNNISWNIIVMEESHKSLYLANVLGKH